MLQPNELKSDAPLRWSPGRGTDVWAMFCACIAGDLVVVERLLNDHPSLACCQYAYRTPLYFAVCENRIAVVDFLLKRGADLHARDEDICSTPLGWAAKFGQKAMVELLFRRGASPNVADDPPWATPLAWANRRGHNEIVDVLKQHGAT